MWHTAAMSMPPANDPGVVPIAVCMPSAGMEDILQP
jgi:hypothetical protein